jgi:hypothetical protein
VWAVGALEHMIASMLEFEQKARDLLAQAEQFLAKDNRPWYTDDHLKNVSKRLELFKAREHIAEVIHDRDCSLVDVLLEEARSDIRNAIQAPSPTCSASQLLCTVDSYFLMKGIKGLMDLKPAIRTQDDEYAFILWIMAIAILHHANMQPESRSHDKLPCSILGLRALFQEDTSGDGCASATGQSMLATAADQGDSSGVQAGLGDSSPNEPDETRLDADLIRRLLSSALDIFTSRGDLNSLVEVRSAADCEQLGPAKRMEIVLRVMERYVAEDFSEECKWRGTWARGGICTMRQMKDCIQWALWPENEAASNSLLAALQSTNRGECLTECSVGEQDLFSRMAETSLISRKSSEFADCHGKLFADEIEVLALRMG